eukprot:CAMPEP_0117444030 /NCGR_PEP_ID=MMETSP0759-20121206/5018_1 /TAXON_ID=63605 /ORGANISM="Percolomonas cosmopolitus, Strain WS" /LENGTH=499 /DNA_ID=CAMNT_0005236059 /DNA_START=383 /DNA_END=1882 /DNA_ORIENTATION=-
MKQRPFQPTFHTEYNSSYLDSVDRLNGASVEGGGVSSFVHSYSPFPQRPFSAAKWSAHSLSSNNNACFALSSPDVLSFAHDSGIMMGGGNNTDSTFISTPQSMTPSQQFSLTTNNGTTSGGAAQRRNSFGAAAMSDSFNQGNSSWAVASRSEECAHQQPTLNKRTSFVQDTSLGQAPLMKDKPLATQFSDDTHNRQSTTLSSKSSSRGLPTTPQQQQPFSPQFDFGGAISFRNTSHKGCTSPEKLFKHHEESWEQQHSSSDSNMFTANNSNDMLSLNSSMAHQNSSHPFTKPATRDSTTDNMGGVWQQQLSHTAPQMLPPSMYTAKLAAEIVHLNQMYHLYVQNPFINYFATSTPVCMIKRDEEDARILACNDAFAALVERNHSSCTRVKASLVGYQDFMQPFTNHFANSLATQLRSLFLSKIQHGERRVKLGSKWLKETFVRDKGIMYCKYKEEKEWSDAVSFNSSHSFDKTMCVADSENEIAQAVCAKRIFTLVSQC